MLFSPPLEEALFLKRYKRFLVDVSINGQQETVHCPNTGSMRGLLIPGQRAWVSLSNNPLRKLPKTLEILEVGSSLVGVNTHLPNALVAAALSHNEIEPLRGYTRHRREVKYGKNSRIDFLLEGDDLPCYVEVKNVHDRIGTRALFPDAVTERGAKHMEELSALSREKKARCVVLYIIQRSDVVDFSLAAEIDPVYASCAQRAREAGVEMYAYLCDVAPDHLLLKGQVPVVGV